MPPAACNGREDALALGRFGLDPRGGDEPEVLAQDPIDAREAARGVGACSPDLGGLEGVGVPPLTEAREREQAVARGVVGALGLGLLVRVLGESERGVRVQPFEARPCEPS